MGYAKLPNKIYDTAWNISKKQPGNSNLPMIYATIGWMIIGVSPP